MNQTSKRLKYNTLDKVKERIFSFLIQFHKNSSICKSKSNICIQAITPLLIHLNIALTCHDSLIGGLKNIFDLCAL